MSCKLKVKRHERYTILRVNGDVTGQDTAQVSKKMESLRNSKCKLIVIDLEEATFIDSYGLGVFVYFWKVLSEENRELIFLAPQNFVQDIFTGTNLDKVFRVVESIDQV